MTLFFDNTNNQTQRSLVDPSKSAESPKEQGFTLLELLIVLAIIALITTLAAPRIIGYLGKAKTGTARAQIESLSTSLELYFLDNGSYPTDQDGLEALVANVSGSDRWNGPYLKKRSGLLDPWERPYLYQSSDQLPDQINAFDILSLGRDGAEGGEGEDADISSSQ